MTITQPGRVAIVDASFDAGFAAWACILAGEAHVRSGVARNSTHAELLAAHLAIELTPGGPLDIRTDCEATAHHLTIRSDLGRPLLREAHARDIQLTVTLVPRQEVQGAHRLALSTFQRKRRGPRPPQTLEGVFSLPRTGGATLEVGALEVSVHHDLSAPLAVVGLNLLAKAATRLPDDTHLMVAGVPESVRDLWSHPGRGWHPCPAFVRAQALALHDRGVRVTFPEDLA